MCTKYDIDILSLISHNTSLKATHSIAYTLLHVLLSWFYSIIAIFEQNNPCYQTNFSWKYTPYIYMKYLRLKSKTVDYIKTT